MTVLSTTEALTLAMMFRSYQLRLVNIDRIRQRFCSVEVEHHEADVPDLVRIWGIRLFRRLQEVIHQHHLNVEV